MTLIFAIKLVLINVISFTNFWMNRITATAWKRIACVK